MDELDYDADMAVWDDDSKRAQRMYDAQDRHENNVDKLIDSRNAVAQKYIKQYNDAVLKDIPNDGSKQAVNRILKKYGGNNYDFGSNTGRDYADDPDYGWSTYNLFDA